MVTTQPTSYGDCYIGHTDAAMDVALWGELRTYIDISMIYVKLPLAPFFRLRQVCKEWNRLASDREFLERTFKPPIANPFFVFTPEFMGDRLLTCQASSWSSMSLPDLPPVKCDVSGLLLNYHFEEDWGFIRILDLHTRAFHTVPPIPTTMLQAADDDDEDEYEYDEPLVGMTVDTTLIPYSFRVILADEFLGTRIYDSETGAWTQKPSTYAHSVDVRFSPSCVSHNQFLYIKVPAGRVKTTFDLHAYDLQRDEWNSETPDVPEDVRELRGIGLWRERLFVFGFKFGPVLTVWDIDHRLQEQWTLFDSMPGGLCAWIARDKDDNLESIQTKFCNEHVLVYNCMGDGEKCVLYNLDRKTWEKVVLPVFS